MGWIVDLPFLNFKIHGTQSRQIAAVTITRAKNTAHHAHELAVGCRSVELHTSGSDSIDSWCLLPPFQNKPGLRRWARRCHNERATPIERQVQGTPLSKPCVHTGQGHTEAPLRVILLHLFKSLPMGKHHRPCTPAAQLSRFTWSPGVNSDFLMFCTDPSSDSNFFSNFVCWHPKCIVLPKASSYTVSACNGRLSFSCSAQIPKADPRHFRRSQRPKFILPKHSSALHSLPDSMALSVKDPSVPWKGDRLIFRLWSGAQLTLNPCQLPGMTATSSQAGDCAVACCVCAAWCVLSFVCPG